MRPQLDDFHTRMNCWLGLLQNNHIDKPLLWKAVKFKLWPAIRYPLSMTRISSSEADSLQSPFFFRLLPYLGVNRNCRKLFRHCPRRYNGLGLPDLHLTKVSDKIDDLLLHGDADTLQGRTMRVSA